MKDLEDYKQYLIDEKNKYNPITLKEAEEKLNLIINPNEKLSFQLNKEEIYKSAKKQLLFLKSMVVTAKKCKEFQLKDPIDFIENIEMLSLLVNYLENDKELKEQNQTLKKI